MSDILTYKKGDGVVAITLNDGKVNALSSAMWDALNEAFDIAEEANAIVTVSGRPGQFSAGFDLREMSNSPQDAIALVTRGSKMARRILSFPRPVIAASTGHCIAMGAFFMLACDYRIGVKGPYRIGLNETMIGLTMHHFGIELARYRLPSNYFNRCVINAEIVSPETAVTAGFYDTIVGPEQIDGALKKTVEGFGALNKEAFRSTKLKSRSAVLALLDDCIERDQRVQN